MKKGVSEKDLSAALYLERMEVKGMIESLRRPKAKYIETTEEYSYNHPFFKKESRQKLEKFVEEYRKKKR
jgi:hypothetical protein